MSKFGEHLSFTAQASYAHSLKEANDVLKIV
ncbi:MAG: hypothetical protein UT50_C0013G0007 [Candidatus Moranbacteria bacterium GW2011_GWA2_39_41]|nr:MAG: hypothetical protein UT50_C0013G0007 [Candidatus Moranbacteria bacterium GW2011_GWA2_39_41]